MVLCHFVNASGTDKLSIFMKHDIDHQNGLAIKFTIVLISGMKAGKNMFCYEALNQVYSIVIAN